MSGIVVAGVDKSFGTTRVLRDVTLSIGSGEFVSLVGPSGCGKTTLMRIIAGLEWPDRGRIEIGSRDVSGVRAAERDVAMVFQNYALYPHLTVQQNIAVPLIFRRLSGIERIAGLGRLVPGTSRRRSEITTDVAAAADALGLAGLLNRKPAQLSGGQRQRVALARAIVREPKAFLMDEPLSNLDASLRVQTRKEIVEIHQRVGASTVYVTHDQSEAMSMSDRVAVMMDGDILQVATPEEIYSDPQDLRVATFIGSPRINTLAAVVGEDGHVRVDGGTTGLLSGHRGPVTLCVRPEDVSPASAGIACRVEHAEFIGDCVLVHARIDASGDQVILRAAATNRAGLKRGASLSIALQAARALAFDAGGKRVTLVADSGAAGLARRAAHG